MSEMVERVARAQAEAIFGKGCPLDEDDFTRARAAIEAMREPTAFMLRSADNAIISDERFESGPFESDKFTWETMIDAALNEEG